MSLHICPFVSSIESTTLLNNNAYFEIIFNVYFSCTPGFQRLHVQTNSGESISFIALHDIFTFTGMSINRMREVVTTIIGYWTRLDRSVINQRRRESVSFRFSFPECKISTITDHGGATVPFHGKITPLKHSLILESLIPMRKQNQQSTVGHRFGQILLLSFLSSLWN